MTDRPTQPKRPDSPTLAQIVAAGIKSLQELAESIGVNVATLQNDFDAKLKHDQGKDKTIDALHQELETHRQDLVRKILQPIVHDLVMLSDDIGGMIGGYDTEQPDSVAEVLGQLEEVQNDLYTIIERYGFELFNTADDHHDKQQQRIQRVIPTDDKTLDHTIAARIRKGVRYGDVIIRPEVVEVYRHKDSIGKQASAASKDESTE